MSVEDVNDLHNKLIIRSNVEDVNDLYNKCDN